jgi:O-antigen ligase
MMALLSLKLKQVGLFLFAASFFLSTAVTNIGLGMLIVAACISFRDCWVTVKGQPLFYLSVLFIVYLLVRQSFGFVHPEGRLSDILPWLYLSLFWLIGWALGKDEAYWRKILLLVAVSFFIRLIIGFDLDRIKLSLSGGHGFGFAGRVATIGFGLYAANMLLGWFLLRTHFLYSPFIKHEKVRFALWLLGFILIAEAIFLANSRGTWLALLVTVCFIVFVSLIKIRKKEVTFTSHRGFFIICSAVVLVLALNTNAVQTRVMSEVSTYKAIITGKGLDEIPYTSAGLRIHMYDHGINMGSQRPWLGWGAESTAWLMSQSDDGHISSFPHFHNGYIEVWLLFGLIGILFFITAFTLFTLGLCSVRRAQIIDNKWLIFLSASFVLMIVWNLFNVRLAHHDYRIYALLILGLAFAVISKVSKQTDD